jgi:transposase
MPALDGIPALPPALGGPKKYGDPGEGNIRREYDRPVPTGWKMVVDLRLKQPGISWRDVAKIVGYSYQTVLYWTKQSGFQRYETFMIEGQMLDDPIKALESKATLDRVRERIESHSEEMLDRLLVILDTSEEPALQAKIAQDLLDRAGLPAQRNEKTARGFTLIMSEEMVKTFMERSREAGLLDVVEGEVTP